MRNREYLSLGFLFVIAMLSLPTVVNAQSPPCGTILQYGAFDTIGATSDEAAASNFVNFMNTNFTSDQGKTFTGGASGGLKYGGIGVDFGQNNNSNEWSKVAQSASAYNSSDTTQMKNMNTLSRQASKVIADAWSRCMSRFGVDAGLLLTDDPNVFYIVFQFHPTGGSHPSTTVTKLSTSGPLKCESIGRTGLLVSIAQVPVKCTRTENVPVTMGFRANDALADPAAKPIFSVPAVPKPVPPPAAKFAGHWTPVIGLPNPNPTNFNPDVVVVQDEKTLTVEQYGYTITYNLDGSETRMYDRAFHATWAGQKIWLRVDFIPPHGGDVRGWSIENGYLVEERASVMGASAGQLTRLLYKKVQ